MRIRESGLQAPEQSTPPAPQQKNTSWRMVGRPLSSQKGVIELTVIWGER
ncbi:hypothetical protein [Brevibacillus parabrevis]|nr:hypothetical protein [Brevibacillus parabrevis]